MAKAKDAFRTISEVSEWLDTPTHVLRFWESKFTQIKPVKRAGGRRYYRPEDMDLLGGIKTLLHEQGMTIKGTQKLLREKGVKHVCTIGPSVTVQSEPKPAPKPAPAPPVIEDIVEPNIDMAAQTQTPLPFEEDMGATLEGPEIAEVPASATNPLDDVPPLSTAQPNLPARFFGVYKRSALKAHASELAPIVARLEQIRDQMRAG